MKKITLLLFCGFVVHFANAQNTCATALPLTTAGLYGVDAVNGTDVPSPICADNGIGATAGEWYTYTPGQNYTVTITTDLPINSGRDTRVHVYTGTCGSFTCYAGDDDGGTIGNGYLSITTFAVTAGTTYYIAWDNKWSASGFTFQLIENPEIILPPTPVSFVSMPIASLTMPYNICAVDMNNDYLDDLVGVSSSNIRIHYQNADGTFTVTDIATPTAEHLPSWSIAAGDYNKDGYNDLLYGSGSGLTLMRSNGLGTGFIKDNPGQNIFCQRTNFIDINNDGNLDAFSCHDIAPNCYYLNNGDATMTFYQSSVTPGAMNFGSIGGNYATIWTDYDNDGDQDVFISKCSGPPCELHRNDGAGVFTDISAIAQVNMTPIQSWSSAVFDYDNDGDMDILIGSNGSSGFKFLRNNLDTTNSVEEPFTNITAGSGWDTNTSTNRDYIAYDFDNDGLLDVMGGGGKIMFNKGNGVFEAGLFPGMSLGAVGDFNNDGFLDIQNGSKIYRNSGNANKWITINLHGIQSNSNGIGARVEIYGSWGKQIRDIRSGEGFSYMSTLNAHFGIGSATTIDQVVIKWPSGTVDTILNPAPNQNLLVTEGAFPLAVNHNENNATFVIYPNPVKQTLNVKWNTNAMNMNSAQVFDLNGKLVLKPQIVKQSVNVESLQAGTYILSLKDDKGTQYTQKFIKS